MLLRAAAIRVAPGGVCSRVSCPSGAGQQGQGELSPLAFGRTRCELIQFSRFLLEAAVAFQRACACVRVCAPVRVRARRVSPRYRLLLTHRLLHVAVNRCSSIAAHGARRCPGLVSRLGRARALRHGSPTRGLRTRGPREPAAGFCTSSPGAAGTALPPGAVMPVPTGHSVSQPPRRLEDRLRTYGLRCSWDLAL